MKLTGGGWMDLLSGDNGAEDAALDDLLKSYDGITPPDLKDLKLEGYEFQGGYEPGKYNAGPDASFSPIEAQLAQLSTMGPSAMEGVSTDPRLQEQQMASMAALDDLARSGGMTATDKANLARIGNDVGTADRGRRGAIQQGMAARGMGGSGMDLLAQLQGSQAATDRQAQQSLDVAGMAQDRALDAMLRSGQLAGDVRGQQFGERSAVAGARDAVSRFNATNANRNSEVNAGITNDNRRYNNNGVMDTQRYNLDKNRDATYRTTSAAEGASRYRADGVQRAADGSVDNRNKGTTYNTTVIPQQRYDNSFRVADAKAGVTRDKVGVEARKTDRRGKVISNVVGGGATTVSSLWPDDEEE